MSARKRMKQWCIRACEVGEGGAGMAVTGGAKEGRLEFCVQVSPRQGRKRLWK
jgi:hypothetical protein